MDIVSFSEAAKANKLAKKIEQAVSFTSNEKVTTDGANEVTVKYTPGLLDVYIDDEYISKDRYTAENGSSIVFNDLVLATSSSVSVKKYASAIDADVFTKSAVNDIISRTRNLQLANISIL